MSPRPRFLKRTGLFIVVIGQEQAEPAVVVPIGGVNAHAADRLAGEVAGYPRGQGDFFELPAALIVEEEVAEVLVVGHEDVGAAVVVVVGGRPIPMPGPRWAAMPDCRVMSLNVPSPLLRKSGVD